MQTRTLFSMTFLLILFIQISIVTENTGAASPATTIELTTPVHFEAPNGDDIVVPSGVYTIDVAEEWLRLTTGEARDAHLLQARRLSHEERVAEPMALSIPSDQDLHHIVVLLPGGEKFTATGTYSGVRSRAPGPLTLNSMNISKALAAKQLTLAGPKALSQTPAGSSSGAQVQVAGAPPPPILTAPAEGQMFAEPTGITFSWRPGSPNPPNVSFEVFAWEAGATQMQERTHRQQAVSVGQVSAKTPHTNSLPNRTLPDNFLGKKVNWIVKACAPNTSLPTFSLTGQSSLACSERPPRELTIQFPAPRLQTPAGGKVNPRLNTKGNVGLLRAEGYSQRTQYLLFCVSKSGYTCGTTPTSFNHPTTFVLQIRPPRFPSTSFGSEHSLTQFVGQTVTWTVAACHPAVGCVWAPPQQLTVFPDPPIPVLLGPYQFDWENSPVHTFAWAVPADQKSNLDYYRFCFFQKFPNECHQTPVNRVVIKETQNTSFQMNLQNHGPVGWASGIRAWQVEACNEGACSSSSINGWKIVKIPNLPIIPVLQNPTDWVLRQDTSVSLTWNNTRDFDTDYFVPCLRIGNKTCEAGNEILNARIPKITQTTGPSSVTYRCTLKGTFPEGSTMVKYWQVGACNEVWGCRWSQPTHVTFAIPASKKKSSAQPLTCPLASNP